MTSFSVLLWLMSTSDAMTPATSRAVTTTGRARAIQCGRRSSTTSSSEVSSFRGKGMCGSYSEAAGWASRRSVQLLETPDVAQAQRGVSHLAREDRRAHGERRVQGLRHVAQPEHVAELVGGDVLDGPLGPASGRDRHHP